MKLCILHKWEDISRGHKTVQECKHCQQVRVLHYTFQGTKKDIYESRKQLETVAPKGFYNG